MSLKKISLLAFLASLSAVGLDQTVSAQTFNEPTPGTYTWSTGTGWTSTPASGPNTALSFYPSSTLAGGNTWTTNNDFAGTFQLNSMALGGTSSGTGSSVAAVNIGGNPLAFVTSSASVSPTLSLNANNGSTSSIDYTVSNNLQLGNNLSVNGAGSGTFNFTGLLSGAGNLTKTGSSKVTFGNGVTLSNDSGVVANINGGFNNYMGTIDSEAGVLDFSGDFLSGGGLIVNGTGANYLADTNGALAFSSITGSGQLGSSSAPVNGALYLFIDYTGATTDSFAGTMYIHNSLAFSGSGNVTLSQAPAGLSAFIDDGSGTVALPSVGAQIQIMDPFSTVKITGSGANVAGGGGITFIRGGTLDIAPSGTSGSTVNVTSTGGFRLYGGATIQLNYGSNTGINFTDPLSSTSRYNSSHSTLVIDPTNAGTLGGQTKFTSTANPNLTNGIAVPWMVTSVGGGSADFLTYVGTTYTSADTGFEAATYNLTNTFAGSSASSVVEIQNATENPTSGGPITLGGNTSVYALRNDTTITATGYTLNIGTNASATFGGLILNGGTINGGTVAFGASEGDIYVSNGNSNTSTISSNVTGAGALVKFGPGTLFLTGSSNSITGPAVIQTGAIDVGTISGGTHATNAGTLGNSTIIYLNGGVLEGNGSLDRTIGLTTGDIAWYDGSGTTFSSNAGGGFAAQGGNLTVDLNSGAALTWGATTDFLPDAEPNNVYSSSAASNVVQSLLMFGSATANSQVIFQNNLNLGSGGEGAYYQYREINVNAGTGSASAELTGTISSSDPHGLLKSGNGALYLTGNNTYSAGTVVAAGALYVNNASGSGTGSGPVTVNSGAKLAGNGTITAGTTAPTGVTINGGASLASGTPGQISGTGLSPVGGLTMNNTLLTVGSASGTANMTFDLGSGTSGINGGTASSHYDFSNPNNNTTYLKLTGSTVINFAGTTSISLVDLTNTNGSNGSLSLRFNSPYLLINAGSNADYLNLVINSGTAANPIYSLSQNDGSVNGWVVGVYTGGTVNAADATPISIAQFGSDGVTALTAGPNGIYADPALYIDAGNFEVVPEPGTWALMLGGLALLVLIQRHRSKWGNGGGRQSNSLDRKTCK
jgi:autotransporter-associated beta strand protein